MTRCEKGRLWEGLQRKWRRWVRESADLESLSLLQLPFLQRIRVDFPFERTARGWLRSEREEEERKGGEGGAGETD